MVWLAGCAPSQKLDSSAQMSSQVGEAAAVRQLAYEHEVVIDAAPDRLAAVHAAGVAACRTATPAGCTLLASRVDSGPRAAAHLKFRARPDVIPTLLQALGRDAALASQSTRAEDLSGPIADSARQLAMLEDYRNRLEALRARAGGDIDALIKVNRELAEVQASIETAQGERAVLTRRVATELLEVDIRTDRRQSFWTPIGVALTEFGGDLAKGVSIAISALAYLLPWLVMLAVALWLARVLWRRRRARVIARAAAAD